MSKDNRKLPHKSKENSENDLKYVCLYRIITGESVKDGKHGGCKNTYGATNCYQSK